MKNYLNDLKKILVKKHKNGNILLKTSEIEQILEITSEMQDVLNRIDDENNALRGENIELLNIAAEWENGI